jgi:hypothetical protein
MKQGNSKNDSPRAPRLRVISSSCPHFLFALCFSLSLILATGLGAQEPGATDEPAIEAPPDTIEIPPGRPDWIGKKPDYTGEIHIMSVASGPYARQQDAEKALDKVLVQATSKYISDQVGPRAAQALRYDAKTIKKRFVKPDNTYRDVARYSVGPMHETFVRLEFGPDFRKEIKAKQRQVVASQRLEETGIAAASSLALLGAAFVFFRFRCKQ